MNMQLKNKKGESELCFFTVGHKCHAKIVIVIVMSRIDSCNSLLYGLPSYLIRRLQYALNSAARRYVDIYVTQG